MPRKDSSESGSHGFGDIIGIALLTLSFLLFVALFSADRGDLAYTKVPPNNPIQNWIGLLGAHLAFWHFQLLGAAGYLVPLALLGLGVAQFFGPLSYLKKSGLWIAVLILSLAGLFDLYSDWLGSIHFNRDSGHAGGMIGRWMNQFSFQRLLGKVGATAIFGALYLISLYFLTNHHLGSWVRSLLGRKKEPGDALTTEEKQLERRAKELERQARELQEQLGKDKVAKTEPLDEEARRGIGADLQPVPEPLIRDLSIPQARPGSPEPPKRPKEPVPPVPVVEPPGEVEVIPAREVRAATAEEILGRVVPVKPAKESSEPEDQPKPELPTTAEPAVEPTRIETATDASPQPSVETPAPSAPPLPPVPVPRPKPPPRRPKPITVASTPKIGNYKLPPLEMLQPPDMTVRPTESREELMANAQLRKNTLAQFGIEVSLGDITKGPTITRYELHPAPGVKLEKIQALNNNLAAALKAERINILTPVPGKSSVGVEVPNAIKTKVILRDILESDEWNHTKARIPLGLGKDVYGHPIVADLADMPHLLIAGSTGSGKSVCINSIIASLLYRFSPDQLRFVMIDPKVVELQQYNALPHLVVPVVTDPKKVILALRWVVNEMEKRYQIFAKVGVRNIKSFNERPKDKPLPKPEPELPLTTTKEKIEASSEGFAVQLDEEIVVHRDEEIVIPEKLSYIVVIIDELADLMLVAPADVEMAIARITQMARAAGIHCIVATQRPSVDVITGVIKANIPARIAFQVAAKVDSRTILDAMGADKLLGKGDMLYLPPGSAKLVRAQGALVTDQEIQSVVDFISQQGKPSYEMEIHQQLSKPVSGFDGDDMGSGEDEDLIAQCIEVIRSEQKASVSLLQRRLRLGYGRAARIMDDLEDRGIVGPSKGAEPRDILIDLDGGGADGQPISQS